MRFKFRPGDDSFYEFFNQAAANLVTGHGVAHRAGAARRRHAQSIAERLGDVEHDSDQITHEVYNKINSTFITPFDREDIYRLASNLDDVMDHIEAAGNLVYLYGLTKLPALPREMHELVDVLDRAGPAHRRRDAAAEGDEGPQGVLGRVNRLENEGDQAYRMLLVRLFSGEYDALTRAEDEGGRRRAGGGLRRLRARGQHRRADRGQGVLSRVGRARRGHRGDRRRDGLRLHQRLPRRRERHRDSVSTRALTPRVALLVAAIGNFVGAHFGAKVAKTVGDGLVDAADRAWRASASSSPA